MPTPRPDDAVLGTGVLPSQTHPPGALAETIDIRLHGTKAQLDLAQSALAKALELVSVSRDYQDRQKQPSNTGNTPLYRRFLKAKLK